MIIGIDITPLLFPGTGVANYTYNLVKNLLKKDKENEYRLFFTSWKLNKKYSFLEEFQGLGARIYRFPLPFQFFQMIWGNLNIAPIEWFIGKVDIFYANDFLRSPSKIKTITTVHDLVWKIYPEFHKNFISKTHEKKIKKTIKYGDIIIADSQTTRKDLISLYPEIDQNRVHVVYPGISENLRPITDPQTLNKYYSKYLLYVGAIDPRKNLITAIEIFSELIKDSKFSDYRFFISGNAGWQKEEIDKRIAGLGMTGRVKLIGYIKDEELPALYSAAKLTLYLSSYEGFGLPPLESLACGTPVLAGDNSSMKETLKEEFLVDVNSKEKILKKMKYLLENDVKIDSSDVQKRFDWTSKAEEFLKIVRQLK